MANSLSSTEQLITVSTPRAARLRRVARRVPWTFVGILALFTLLAAFAPFIAPHDYQRPDARQIQEPPVWAGGTWTYPLGTDNAGRDVLSRIIHGGRTSLAVTVSALVFATSIGAFAGLTSGYFGGKTDSVIMRLVDAFLAMPSILIALLALAIFGSSTTVLVGVIALVMWAPIARVIRSDALSLRERPFVEAAEAVGASSFRIILRHILPNTVASLTVLVSLLAGSVILLESALSFLGLGVQPPGVSWGSMVAGGRQFLRLNHWLVTIPGVAIFLTVMAFNRIGDWLRDELDPRQRGR